VTIFSFELLSPHIRARALCGRKKIVFAALDTDDDAVTASSRT
jgi:hypothetical protein